MRRSSEFRLGRPSLAILIVLSALATFVILSGGHGRTHAEMAALAALRERPATRTVVAAAPVTPAPTPTGSSDNSAPAGSGDSTAPSSTDTASAPTSDDGENGSGDGSSDGNSDGSSTTTTSTTPSTTPPADSNLPKVGHVFEIALSTTGYQAAFGTKGAAYLRSLEPKGTLLSGYQSLGSSELADNLAVISGQPPNSDTRGGCTTYSEFPTAVVAKANGLVPGAGCVYPETALTIGDQVSSSGHIWRAYIEDQGKQACEHANSNALDDLPLPGSGPGYDSRHNPFIYFHSLLDLGDCSTDDLDLSKLPAALSSTSKTATFTYLAPNACSDARAIAGGTAGSTSTAPTTTPTTPTTGSSTASTSTTTTSTTTTSTSATPTTGTTPGAATGTTPSTVSTTAVSGALGSPTAAACPVGPVGIVAENAFLKKWVPLILHSAAYQKDGVLVIGFSGDGAKRAGPQVRTGALVLSRYARRGQVVKTAYSPYSLLRSLEDMLRYTPLAKAKSAPSFAAAALRKTD